MWTHIIMEEHYTDVNIHNFLFWMALHSFFCSVLQHTSDVTVVSCCMIPTISTSFLSQKTVSISFLADVCLIFFWVVLWICVYPLLYCSLVSTFTDETQVLSPVMMWLRNSLQSLWHCCKNVKVEANLCILWPPLSILEPILCETYDSLV
jgi:hypothetical protein